MSTAVAAGSRGLHQRSRPARALGEGSRLIPQITIIVECRPFLSRPHDRARRCEQVDGSVLSPSDAKQPCPRFGHLQRREVRWHCEPRRVPTIERQSARVRVELCGVRALAALVREASLPPLWTPARSEHSTGVGACPQRCQRQRERERTVSFDKQQPNQTNQNRFASASIMSRGRIDQPERGVENLRLLQQDKVRRGSERDERVGGGRARVRLGA